MKKRHTTIILGLTLLKMCLSCTSEKHHEVSETFTNNSGKDITAYSYKKSATDTVYTIKDTVIKNNLSIRKTWVSYGPVITPHNLYLLFDGDSIVIDFGDRTECFMFNKQNHFTEQKLSDNNLYVLTPDDYTNAAPKP